MTAATQRTPRTGPRPGASRFMPCRRGPHRSQARPSARLAGQKLASRVFAAAPVSRAPAVAAQSLGTHQESAVFYWGVTPGCVVAPNSLAARYDPASGNWITASGKVQTATVGTGSLQFYDGDSGTWKAPTQSNWVASNNGLAPVNFGTAFEPSSNYSFVHNNGPAVPTWPSSQNSDAALFNAVADSFGQSGLAGAPMAMVKGAAIITGGVGIAVVGAPVVAAGFEAWGALTPTAKVFIVSGALRVTYGVTGNVPAGAGQVARAMLANRVASETAAMMAQEAVRAAGHTGYP